MIRLPIVFLGKTGLICRFFAGTGVEGTPVSVVAEPLVVFVADIADFFVAADRIFAFGVEVPASYSVVEVDNSAHPNCFPVPNYDYFPSVPSSVAVVDEGCVGSPSGVRTNSFPCSIFSSVG